MFTILRHFYLDVVTIRFIGHKHSWLWWNTDIYLPEFRLWSLIYFSIGCVRPLCMLSSCSNMESITKEKLIGDSCDFSHPNAQVLKLYIPFLSFFHCWEYLLKTDGWCLRKQLQCVILRASYRHRIFFHAQSRSWCTQWVSYS